MSCCSHFAFSKHTTQKIRAIGIQIDVQQLCCDAMVRWFLQNRRVSQTDPNPSFEFLQSGRMFSHEIAVFRFYEAAVRGLRQSVMKSHSAKGKRPE